MRKETLSVRFDTFYKGCIIVGAVLLGIAVLFVPGRAGAIFQLLAAGIFLVGIGEWRNRDPSNHTRRAANLAGMAVDGIGALLFGAGVVFLVFFMFRG